MKLQEKLQQMRKNKKGQSMAEYAIIITLIALVCIGAITAFGDKIKAVFFKSANTLQEGLDKADEE